jgi:hypothetical protein
LPPIMFLFMPHYSFCKIFSCFWVIKLWL